MQTKTLPIKQFGFKEPYLVTTDSSVLDITNARIMEEHLDKNYMVLHIRGLGKFCKWKASLTNDSRLFTLTKVVDKDQLSDLSIAIYNRGVDPESNIDVQPFEIKSAQDVI